jgi:hypothetical protein
MAFSAMVLEEAPVYVTGPATLTSWSWDDFIPQAEPGRDLDAFYARMIAKYRSMPPLAHHEHGPRGEIHPI